MVSAGSRNEQSAAQAAKKAKKADNPVFNLGIDYYGASSGLLVGGLPLNRDLRVSTSVVWYIKGPSGSRIPKLSFKTQDLQINPRYSYANLAFFDYKSLISKDLCLS